MSIETVTVVVDDEARTIQADGPQGTIFQTISQVDGEDVLYAIGRAVVLASGQYEEV